MTNTGVFVALVSVALVSAALLPVGVLAEGANRSGERYCPQTGHYVAKGFLTFYEAHGGAALLGFPRSEAFLEEGAWVQYFEAVRLECDGSGGAVHLANLGDLWRRRTAPVAAGSARGRYYAQTGHTLAHEFVAFYDTQGGAAFFGYPISEATHEDGRLVQYLERARLDWLADKQQVKLGPLGALCIKQGWVPALYTRAATATLQPDSAGAGAAQDKPQFITSVKYATTGQGGKQTVYVRAMDAQGQGVANVAVEVIVHEQEQERRFALPPTDRTGKTALSYPIGTPARGCEVLVEAVGQWQGGEVRANARYLPWW